MSAGYRPAEETIRGQAEMIDMILCQRDALRRDLAFWKMRGLELAVGAFVGGIVTALVLDGTIARLLEPAVDPLIQWLDHGLNFARWTSS